MKIVFDQDSYFALVVQDGSEASSPNFQWGELKVAKSGQKERDSDYIAHGALTLPSGWWLVVQGEPVESILLSQCGSLNSRVCAGSGEYDCYSGKTEESFRALSMGWRYVPTTVVPIVAVKKALNELLESGVSGSVMGSVFRYSSVCVAVINNGG